MQRRLAYGGCDDVVSEQRRAHAGSCCEVRQRRTGWMRRRECYDTHRHSQGPSTGIDNTITCLQTHAFIPSPTQLTRTLITYTHNLSNRASQLCTTNTTGAI